MWQTDTITLQTYTETNYLGSITRTWTDGNDILCDVQDISKELVYKNYGFTEIGNYKQIFDHNNSSWILGNQVKYDSKEYLIVMVNSNMAKMGASNHTFVIMKEVI